MALGQQSLGNSNDPSAPEFDLWVQGKRTHVEDGTRQSDLGLLYTGFDWSDERDETQSTHHEPCQWLAPHRRRLLQWNWSL